MCLCLQATCRIRDQYIDASTTRRIQRIERDGSWVGAALLCNQFGTTAICPDADLFGGSRAESVACSEHHLETIACVAGRELADTRGFARTIHTDDKDGVGLVSSVDHERFSDRL